MQSLEVSGAVRLIYGSLGVKRLIIGVRQSQEGCEDEISTICRNVGGTLSLKTA